MSPALIDWRERSASPSRTVNQIYLHIPFCPFLCHFCPLYKVTDGAERTAASKAHFVETLLAEIAMYGRNAAAGGQIYDSIYFGGGTPTELTAAQLARILMAVRRNFRLAPNAEISLEGVARQMLAPDYLAICVDAGFNRISFGVQSLEVSLRKRIGRGDGVDDYPATIHLAKTLDPKIVVNTEIMAGLPEQSYESFSADVRQLVAWNVDSLDILYYVLMPGTRLQDFVQEGKRGAPAYGGSMLQMRELVNATLRSEGFRQVTGEVFSRTDRDLFVEASFGGGSNALNTVLALGPSSFGLLEGTAYHNVADLKLYTEAVERGLYPTRAALPLTTDVARRRAWAFAIMKLHLPAWLIETAAERRRVARWEELGLCRWNGAGYDLTPRGRVWYNHMQMEVLPLWEKIESSRLFGTASEQKEIFARDHARDSLAYELRQTITEGNPWLSPLRALGYRMLLGVRSRSAAGADALSFTARPVADKPVQLRVSKNA